MKSKGAIKGLIVGAIIVLLIVGYYFYLSNRKADSKPDQDMKISPAREVTLLNFDINYPPTPKEVVKTYLDITKVLHNENLTEEEITQVAMKLKELFDDELANNKADEEYIQDLKSELVTFKQNNYSIVNYYASTSTEVEEFVMDGFLLARLYGTYNIRTSNGTQVLTNVFILRKDAKSRWKIYGWQPITTKDN